MAGGFGNSFPTREEMISKMEPDDKAQAEFEELAAQLPHLRHLIRVSNHPDKERMLQNIIKDLVELIETYSVDEGRVAS